MKDYRKLDCQQIDAINTIQGPVMIISCAGSGKTTVILERTNNVIKAGVSPEKILVVTFSKAAALEMKDRFVQKYQSDGVKFATIHSICYTILAKAYGLNSSAILKISEKNMFFYDMYIKLKRKFGADFYTNYKDIGEFCKEMELKISGFMSLMYRNNLSKCTQVTKNQYEQEVFISYLDFKKSSGKIDYDDMIIDTHRYLKENHKALEEWRSTYQYIMIDEYQDTSILQSEIFFMLANKGNICVVGDDDQSIYSFRNADSAVFKRFLAEYPEAKKIFLETNYRSQPQIIRLAAHLIEHNVDRFSKEFKTFKYGTAKITKRELDDSLQQSNEVINLIKDYERHNIPLNNISVLYRIRSESSIICSRLMAEKIPFYTKELPDDIHKGLVYQDIKAYYRLANGMQGKMDLRRIINRPKRYIKAENLSYCNLDMQEIFRKCTRGIIDGERKERIHEVIRKLFIDLDNLKEKSPTDFMEYLCDKMKYRESLIEYAKFLKIDANALTAEFDTLMLEAKKFETMFEWDEYAREYRNELFKAMEKNKEIGVYFSTFHSAKGLEWDNVLIISANDRITPYERKGVIENLEEERRLFYVAMTRAREELHIIHYKNDHGAVPSRFLDEIFGT